MDDLDRGRHRAAAWVVGEIGTFALPGLGAWPKAWEMTEEAAKHFNLAILAWDGSRKGPLATRLREKGQAYIEAWREANEAYRRDGGQSEHGDSHRDRT